MERRFNPLRIKRMCLKFIKWDKIKSLDRFMKNPKLFSMNSKRDRQFVKRVLYKKTLKKGSINILKLNITNYEYVRLLPFYKLVNGFNLES